jgi:hypothetical protein
MSQAKIVYEIPKWFKEKREIRSFTQKELSKDKKIKFAQLDIFDYQYDDEYANRLVYYRIVVLGEGVFIYEQKRGRLWNEDEESNGL